MTIGPLEYVAIGLQDNPFVDHILPELNAIQKKGPIRVVDLLFVTKDTETNDEFEQEKQRILRS